MKEYNQATNSIKHCFFNASSIKGNRMGMGRWTYLTFPKKQLLSSSYYVQFSFYTVVEQNFTKMHFE